MEAECFKHSASIAEIDKKLKMIRGATRRFEQIYQADQSGSVGM
jgi:hypothetical protein